MGHALPMDGRVWLVLWMAAGGDQGRRSIYRIGGGGARVRKISNFSARRRRAKSQYKLHAQNAPQIENCICLVVFSTLNLMVLSCLTVLLKPILALHIMIFFSSCRNYWGGGVGQNDMFATPIVSWGTPMPPPPPGSGGDEWFQRKEIFENDGLRNGPKNVKICRSTKIGDALERNSFVICENDMLRNGNLGLKMGVSRAAHT